VSNSRAQARRQSGVQVRRTWPGRPRRPASLASDSWRPGWQLAGHPWWAQLSVLAVPDVRCPGQRQSVGICRV